jgi:carbamate kinase
VPEQSDLVVVAVGGNSLTQPGQIGTLPEQRVNAQTTCEAIAGMVEMGYRVVLTHGNGPQVGNVLWRVELAAHQVYRLPLDVCGADTQGGIGYMLQQILGDELRLRGLDDRVATVVTQVLVDANDPDFLNPSKPVGPFMPEDKARQQMGLGWQMVQVDSRGWRRVVPSPRPLRILEFDAIKAVVATGGVCICTGGGGVPVFRDENGRTVGLQGVIDKDRASCLLAKKLGADRLVISTGVPEVRLDFDTPNERPVREMTVDEAQTHLDAGQFPAGSMGPKIEAAIEFLRAGGKRVLITDPPNLTAALDLKAGTVITAN